ncbi:TRAP transporter small permease [Martelella mediterranea]|uniref:TRAP transporter small permease protein n=1 Tax=Martelella mediterranea DSM 17316 TaxID=1122214 RepID=A0A1U9YVH6_9HYPH|nr:TRAP transporter small permease subunit [Martelella mediterranea]AQZ49424.1 TRAP-type C4-dicarboxylate transport system, small permease component [Martelella mediterranea DSM 17316]
MRALDGFLDAIASLFKGLATLCLAVMVALNLFNVAFRAVFDHAFGWIFSWTLLLFIWMLLLGFFVYMRNRRDVVVDIFMSRLPPVGRRIGGMFACLVGMAVMAAILRGAPALISLQRAPMDGTGLPIWTQSLPLFVSAALVFAHFLLSFIEIATGRAEAFPRDIEPVEKGAVE